MDKRHENMRKTHKQYDKLTVCRLPRHRCGSERQLGLNCVGMINISASYFENDVLLAVRSSAWSIFKQRMLAFGLGVLFLEWPDYLLPFRRLSYEGQKKSHYSTIDSLVYLRMYRTTLLSFDNRRNKWLPSRSGRSTSGKKKPIESNPLHEGLRGLQSQFGGCGQNKVFRPGWNCIPNSPDGHSTFWSLYWLSYPANKYLLIQHIV